MTTETKGARPGRATLGELYARLGAADLPAWIDADILSGHAAGTLPAALARRVDAVLARSPDLLALRDSLVALAPDAVALAGSLPQHAGGHRRRPAAPAHRGTRQARSRRGFAPWVGVAAAMVLAVAGVWGLQDLLRHDAGPAAEPAATMAETADQIFNWGSDRGLAAEHAPEGDDLIFRAAFADKS